LNVLVGSLVQNIDKSRSFYIHHHPQSQGQSAIQLVPTAQFEAFLKEINRTLKISLAIPSGSPGHAFQVTFEDDTTPQPRYLGRAESKEMADDLKLAIPPSSFRPNGESIGISKPTDGALIAFKGKMDLMAQAAKVKKNAQKERQKAKRLDNQRSWSDLTKRVQRYLGLRQNSQRLSATAGIGRIALDSELANATKGLSMYV
jgi:hypothetical protein